MYSDADIDDEDRDSVGDQLASRLLLLLLLLGASYILSSREA